MRRLWIIPVVVLLLLSSCASEKVLTVMPLSTTTTSTGLAWDDVANLPIGTEVDLMGYTSKTYTTGNNYFYYLSQEKAMLGDIWYIVLTPAQLADKTYVHIKVRVEAANNDTDLLLGVTQGSKTARVLQEISRKVITQN